MAGLVRSVDLAELRAFCAAVDLGSLGRAARLLRVSQPALSKRMRALEALAGAPLLERSPRGITPTGAGERLYVEARRLLQQADSVEELLAGLGDDAPVRLAVSHTIAEFVLPGPLVEFELQRRRHLSVELLIANSIVVRELVSDGRAEFGIAAAEKGGPGPLHEEAFCDDEVIVAVPEGHPWRERREIPLRELVRMPMVMRDPSANTRRVVEAELAERGLELAPPLAEVGSTSAAKEAALSEGAPALLSRLAIGRDDAALAIRRPRGLRFTRSFVLLLGAEETLAPPARALLDHLRRVITQG
ncbi:MAG: LysR family transcriptional regulator [Thermoleophilaceae bacterium]